MSGSEKTGGKQRRKVEVETQSQKRIGVYLTNQEYEFIKGVANSQGKTMSLYVREAALKKAEEDSGQRLEDLSTDEDEP